MQNQREPFLTADNHCGRIVAILQKKAPGKSAQRHGFLRKICLSILRFAQLDIHHIVGRNGWNKTAALMDPT